MKIDVPLVVREPGDLALQIALFVMSEEGMTVGKAVDYLVSNEQELIQDAGMALHVLKSVSVD